MTVIERFKSYIIYRPGTRCWLWCGSTDTSGYGKILVRRKLIPAHRLAYEYYVGPIPAGLEIDHLCRVRHCVNPDHLEAVTHRENLMRGFRAVQEEAMGPVPRRITLFGMSVGFFWE
jgi:hypothetical protein